MRRADRLFQLVQLLRNRRFATAETLAEHLGVSVRTVYRDIPDLIRSGVPIRGEAGVGYRLDESAELPPMTFTADEMAALVLGSRMVEAWCDPELASAARAAMAKIEAVVPESLKAAIFETPLYAPVTPLAKNRRKALQELREAIASKRKIALTYTKENGDTTERTVRPLGLYFFGSRWCLGAWCELRTEYRVFRPDRISALDVLEETYDDTDGIDLAGFLAHVTQS